MNNIFSDNLPKENKIPANARQNTLDGLVSEGRYWSGKLNEIEFLDSVFNLDKIRSRDPRYTDVRDEINCHSYTWYDWPDNWVFSDSRFNLKSCSDDIFLNFLCRTLHPRTEREEKEYSLLLEIYNDEIKKYGFEIFKTPGTKDQKKTYSFREIGSTTPFPKGTLSRTDYVEERIEEMKKNIEENPPAAIGQAKDLIETVCKDVLLENSDFEKSDIDKLTFSQLKKKTLEALELIPENIKERGKTSEIIKSILGNLSGVASNVNELRNIHGAGHGKDSGYQEQGLQARHAQLVVESTITFINFILNKKEKDRKNK